MKGLVFAVAIVGFAVKAAGVVPVGSFDGYATISFPSQTTVASAASVTYYESTYLNCGEFGSTQCGWVLSGVQNLQPGFQTPYEVNGTSYRNTIQGPSEPSTCYQGSLDAGISVWTDNFGRIPVGSAGWSSDTSCTPPRPSVTYHLTVFMSLDGASYQSEYLTNLEPGSSVMVTAIPPQDYVFIGWTGDLTSSSNPATFFIFSDMVVTANFIYVPPNPKPWEPPPCDNCGPGNDNPPNSPIVLNFGHGGGYRLSGAGDPVAFDIAATGTPVRIGWTAAGTDEAFLCLDRNGNGTIDDGSELFGTATRLASGARAPNGYAALAEYDDNHDGVIDAQDAIWTRLLLWRDLNHDAVSQPSEMSPVVGSALRAISLTYHWTGRRDASGNTFRYEALGWFANGATVTARPVYDIFFVSAL